MQKSDKQRYLMTLRGEVADRVPIHETIFNGRYIRHATECNGYEGTHEGMPPEDLVPMLEGIGVDMAVLGYYWRPEAFATWEKVRETPFPEPKAFLAHVDRFVEYLKGRSTGLLVYVHGPMDSAYLSMGYMEFFTAVKTDPALVEAVMERLNKHHIELVHELLRRPIDVIQIVDDVAMRSGAFIEPKLMREWWEPRMWQLIAPLRKASMPMQFHSDGAIETFMEPIIEMGFLATNPIDPLCNDIRAVKKRYGDHITLMGNLDLNILGQGTPDEVRSLTRELLRDLMPGGRYISMSGSSISDAVKPENYDAMVETVLEHGWYR